MLDDDLYLSEYKKQLDEFQEKHKKLKESYIRMEELYKLSKNNYEETKTRNKILNEENESLENNKKKLENEQDKLDKKISTLNDKYEELKKQKNYILQMDDNSFELVSKDDVDIADDIKKIKEYQKPEDDIGLLQIHFTEIDEDKYNELQDKDWCPFVDLMDYSANAVIRFYDREGDKLTQLRWDIPREDVIKLKDLYVKKDSFWMEPDTDNGDYSYMALIWNGEL